MELTKGDQMKQSESIGELGKRRVETEVCIGKELPKNMGMNR
jgi:hypothetical protein